MTKFSTVLVHHDGTTETFQDSEAFVAAFNRTVPNGGGILEDTRDREKPRTFQRVVTAEVKPNYRVQAAVLVERPAGALAGSSR